MKTSGGQAFLRYNPMYLYPCWWIQSHPQLLNRSESPDPSHVKLYLERMDIIVEADNLENVASIRCPALVLSAQDDLLIPTTMGDEVAHSLQHSHRHVFSKGEHYYPVVMAETFNQVVMDFLNNLNNLCPMQPLNH
ncbi:alpha/beta fold hydrolase [Endozoicomonas lisbonensis]|uniref:alpha/beta fold hydrolase n=1 Tax=Endozoicomonas lisbonensis TaxID=3120522 RepID=UPI0033953748